jgi:hypothetical protein
MTDTGRALELPAPRTVPMGMATGPLARLSKAERRLVEGALAGAPVYWAVRTATRADVGGWTGPRRVWAFALADDLVLAAAGRKPRIERTPFADLRETLYNHVTGELDLAPADGLRLRRLRMAPLDAYQVLAQIHRGESDDVGTD